jgi:hypothetical protein
MEHSVADPPDVSQARTLIGATVPFYFLVISLFFTRIWVRMKRKKFGVDDIFLSLAIVHAYPLC